MPRPARNIELKARVTDWDQARQLAARLGTEPLSVQEQVDTYFHCPRGRLKLREIQGQTAQLISYSRADHSNARASDYLLVPVADPDLLRQALATALGVRVVVRKRREITLYHNVRIHLDQVEGLGDYLEFESVLSAAVDETLGRERLEWLRKQFSIADADLLSHSYGELLAGSGPNAGN